MKKSSVVLTTAVSAVALAGVVGIGVASADPTSSPTSTSTPSASSAPTPDPKTSAGEPSQDKTEHRDLARRALHGEVTLGGTKHRVVDVQRGTVSAVSGTSVTVRSADGFVGSYVVGPTTRVRVAGHPAAIGAVATGDRVRVVAVRDGATLTATRVAARRH